MSDSVASPLEDRSDERPRRRVLRWIVVALVVIVVFCVAWIGIRGLLAVRDLRAAANLASTVQTQVSKADVVSASRTATTIADKASSARRLTGDPIWRAGEILPLVGPDLRAVRQISANVADVADDGLLPLAKVAGTLSASSFTPVNGKIDLQPLVAAQPALHRANAAITRGIERSEQIDTSNTVSPVTDAVKQLRTGLQKASQPLDAADRAATLLPAMLGADGPRNELFVFQNNAELRARGGIVGALALVHTDDGAVNLTQQGSSSSFPHYAAPVVSLPLQTRGIYGDITGEYVQDATLTPKFPLSAKIVKQMWQREYGTQIDGVVSIDPVALAYLLKATGPVTLPTGDTLTSDNAVSFLLKDVYARYSVPAEQDAFFASAASAVFTKVAGGDFDPAAMLSALGKAGDEHRVLLWSDHAAEQRVLAPTTLAGRLPTSTSHDTTIGVYLNDATGAKMDTYLHTTVQYAQATCRKDALPDYQVTVTLRSDAPADAATSLPEYVTGGGSFGVTPGNVKTNVSVYGPKGGSFVGATKDGEQFGLHPATDSGYPVALYPVELAPGQSETIVLHFVGSKPTAGALQLEHTPTITTPQVQNVALSCDALGE